MTGALLLGAFFAFAIGLAHSVLGERYILIRLFRRTNLPRLFGGDEFTRRTLRFGWHATTLAWWGFAAQLVLLSLLGSGDRAAVSMVQIIAGVFAFSAVVAVVASRGKHLSWLVFLAIAACIWAAVGAI